MGYKALCNFSAGRGLDFKGGDAYTGPSELIENLLKEKLIIQDELVKAEPSSLVPDAVEVDDVFEEPEAKQKKPSKKKK